MRTLALCVSLLAIVIGCKKAGEAPAPVAQETTAMTTEAKKSLPSSPSESEKAAAAATKEKERKEREAAELQRKALEKEALRQAALRKADEETTAEARRQKEEARKLQHKYDKALLHFMSYYPAQSQVVVAYRTKGQALNHLWTTALSLEPQNAEGLSDPWSPLMPPGPPAMTRKLAEAGEAHAKDFGWDGEPESDARTNALAALGAMTFGERMSLIVGLTNGLAGSFNTFTVRGGRFASPTLQARLMQRLRQSGEAMEFNDTFGWHVPQMPKTGAAGLANRPMTSLERAISLVETQKSNLRLAKKCIEANDIPKAKEHLKEYLKNAGPRGFQEHSETREARRLLKELEDESKAAEEKAKQRAEQKARLKAREPETRKSLLKLAKQFLDSGDTDVAKRRLSQLAKQHPDSDEAKEATKLLRKLEEDGK